jgi:hypothetical protein
MLTTINISGNAVQDNVILVFLSDIGCTNAFIRWHVQGGVVRNGQVAVTLPTIGEYLACLSTAPNPARDDQFIPIPGVSVTVHTAPSSPPPMPDPTFNASTSFPVAAVVAPTVVALLLLALSALLYRRDKRPHRPFREVDLELSEVVKPDALPEKLRVRVNDILDTLAATGAPKRVDVRFTIALKQMILGEPEEAALGIDRFMRVASSVVHAGMAQGVAAIVAEFEAAGTESDRECLRYVMHERAGSSDKEFPNGVRDQGRNGEVLEDFVNHTHSQQAGLSVAHVLALRLYTTAAFVSLNTPLRDVKSTSPHPFPVTIRFITEAIKQLRSVGASQDSKGDMELWRGLRDLTVDSSFMEKGGTEIAPMSTTTSLVTAIKYSYWSDSSVLLKLTTSSFMQRGADLSFLSAFPGEAEVLYPPLTFLQPVRHFEMTLDNSAQYTVIEVVPHIGS